MGETTPVGEILRDLRRRRGESLRGAASGLGIDPSYLSKVERGEKPIASKLRGRLADYYDADAARLALAEGDLPPDVLRILAEHPEAMDELRERYGTS